MSDYKKKLLDFDNAINNLEKNMESFLSYNEKKLSFDKLQIKAEVEKLKHKLIKIIDSLEEIGLKVHLHSSKKPINESVDVYIVDTYGETETFLKMSKIVFLGGSLIKRGGQNPLEPARIGCKVIHGPHVEKFQEVYLKSNRNTYDMFTI